MKKLVILLLLLTSYNVFAQKTYKIGVKESEPFVIKYDNGQWGGLCLDIIEDISKVNGFEYELIEIKGTYDDAINLVEIDSLDMLALDMTISKERLQRVNFTQPYFTTPTGIAVVKQEVSIIDKILTVTFLKSILFGLGVLLILGLLMWLVERKYNDKISESPVGILDGTYFIIVILSTVGFGDITPISKWGKSIVSIVILLSLFLFTTLTGMISSSLTVNELEGQITTMSELNQLKTGTIEGTFSEKMLSTNEIKTINYDSPIEAFNAINDGELDAFVYDKAILDYLSNQDRYDHIVVSDNTFNTQTYGFALKKGDSLVNELNPIILDIINNDKWDSMLSQYKID